jgi:hypothetical protein
MVGHYAERFTRHLRALSSRLRPYKNEGHVHRVSINGGIDSLNAPIYHDDRKPLARWFLSQQRYARREAEHLLKSDRATLRRTAAA